MEVKHLADPDRSHHDVAEFCTFVAVDRAVARDTLQRLHAGRIKGESVQLRRAGAP